MLIFNSIYPIFEQKIHDCIKKKKNRDKHVDDILLIVMIYDQKHAFGMLIMNWYNYDYKLIWFD